MVSNGTTVATATVPVGQALPGVFYIDNSDGSQNSASNPAAPGDFVAIFGTGGGVTNPPGVTGASWPLAPLSLLSQSIQVTIGGENANVLYSGSAPTLNSGFFQINVRLPLDLASGTQSLSVTAGGVKSLAALIAIR